MVKINAQLKFISIGLLAFASHLAYGQETATRQNTVGLEEVLRGFRSKYSLSSYNAKLQDFKESKVSNASRRFQSAPNLGVEAESSIGEERERKVTARIKQNITLGIDQNVLSDRYSSESAADLTAKEAELKDQEKEIASLYTSLRLSNQMFMTSKSTLAILEPLVKKAKRAAESGNLGGFFARRWQILLAKIQSDNAEAQQAYSTHAGALASAAGIAIPLDPSLASLSSVSAQSLPTEFQQDRFLPLKENLLRQKALAAEATHVQSISEVSAGIGYTRDLDTQKSGIVLEVEIPIFSSAVARSVAQEVISQKSVLAASGDLSVKRAQDQFLILSSAVKRAQDAQKLAEQRVDSLNDLYRDAQKAFDRAQAEIAEVVETLSELYEAQVRLAEKTQELEESIINLQYLAGGSP